MGTVIQGYFPRHDTPEPPPRRTTQPIVYKRLPKKEHSRIINPR